jgi:ubiquinone/menaquinone biosynthesis C-methylase UbiE
MPEAPEDQGARAGGPAPVDSFVQRNVGETCGTPYWSQVGRLARYPIPKFRLGPPTAQGQLLLDVGCNWGRWSISAERAGYAAVGIDPSVEAVLAACRVARQLGARVHYLVADARFLPFKPRVFHLVFSYNVFHHMAKRDALASIAEAGRVARSGGMVAVQMSNRFGARGLYNFLRTGGREPKGREIRFWTPRQLHRSFSRLVGRPRFLAEGYLSLNPQPTDLDLLPVKWRAIVRVSGLLRRLSDLCPLLRWTADSLLVIVRKTGATPP